MGSEAGSLDWEDENEVAEEDVEDEEAFLFLLVRGDFVVLDVPRLFGAAVGTCVKYDEVAGTLTGRPTSIASTAQP